MTPLPAVIRKAGFELTMIKRLDRVAIYRQHLPGGNPDHDAYEVILPQVRNTNHEGRPVEPYEGYPAAESCGKKGWTVTDLAKAVQRLKELTRKASCAGTVSRRNRRYGRQAIIRLRRRANAARPRLPSKNFTRPVGQRHQAPVKGEVRIFWGIRSHGLAPYQNEPNRN
jgi:hypothetical protein